jgi:hypothetical protein
MFEKGYVVSEAVRRKLSELVMGDKNPTNNRGVEK